MGAAAIVTLVAQLIAQLGPLALQAVQAEQAGDQTTLDAIHAQAVAASNALFPPDVKPVAVD